MPQLTLDAVDPIRNELERKYRVWLHEHESVFALFERFAMQMLHRQRRFGIKMLAERVRWEVATTFTPDDEGYKINNNYTAYIARDLIQRHPALANLIETRCIKATQEDDWLDGDQ